MPDFLKMNTLLVASQKLLHITMDIILNCSDETTSFLARSASKIEELYYAIVMNLEHEYILKL